MSERKIKLREMEDVRDFVRAAETCDYDVDISYNRVVIDAKSLLGVLSLDLTKELTVKFCEEDLHFMDILDKYAVP